MSTFAYSVAIKLTVANLASQGIRLLGKDLLAAHGQAVSLENKLKALKMTAVGFGIERAGKGILGFMDKAVNTSKEYTHQLALMNAAGMTHKEIAGSVAAAWSTSRSVITSSATENLKAIRELRSVFGQGEGMNHAYAVLPTVQRAQAIMSSLTGKEQPGLAFDMIKAIEFGTKGAVTVPGMLRQAEMMTKALVAFQGTLSVADFHATLKASKAAAPFLSDEFKYTILPTIMQEMKSGHGGAQAAGTALATLFGTIKGHAIMTRMIPAWVTGGLIRPGGIVTDAHHRGMSRVGPNGIVDENLFTNNPLAWAQKDLIPARDRLMKKLHVDEIGAYYALTGNRNTAFMFQTLANKGAQIARDQKLIAAVGSSYGAYQQLLKKDPQLAEQAMHAQWQNVLSILGYQILPKLLPYMVKFANVLDGISQFMERHPRMTEGLAIGGAVSGVGMVLGGKALMTAGIMKFLGVTPSSILTAGKGALSGGVSKAGSFLMSIGNSVLFLGRALFMNPIGLTLLAVGAAAYVLYRNWKTVGPYVKEVWSIIKAVFHVSMHAISTKAKEMWATVGPYIMKAWSILKAVGSKVGDTFASIYSAVTGWLGKIVNWIAGSWIGKAIGYVASGIGSAVKGDFNEAYAWSQGVNRQYEGSPFVKHGGHVAVTVHHTTKLGDKTIAQHTAKLMGKAMSAPNNGPVTPDYSRHPMRPAGA